MPKFTIETTYDLPVYRHTTYEAETAEEAFAMAMADEDWSGQKEDIESSHDTRITGAWAGAQDHEGDPLPIPAELGSGNQMEKVLRWIDEHYDDQDMSHLDFRVKVASLARETLA